ncbi:NAD(+)--rifampin ADP-ribosyltransferase [Staphylococcus xylosus]|uniref:NAD(+)--rifampin ADP-ribosyltransferase n=1 Tax=Staphylococcus xylosus TaxID=1288 RepID=UPI001CDB9E53|nr:NAD(+)--rifampin ADP-ribosyltransferase [Staphylococcus xylosus]UBV40328.1 NAD(+)--rifampin ADP-ribosyltransferase [Staphylococcus xylosus]
MENQKQAFEQDLYLHGTKVQWQIGDLLKPLHKSNYQDRIMNHIYFTGTLEAAKWGAELASWESHSKEEISQMVAGIKQLRSEGLDVIED